MQRKSHQLIPILLIVSYLALVSCNLENEDNGNATASTETSSATSSQPSTKTIAELLPGSWQITNASHQFGPISLEEIQTLYPNGVKVDFTDSGFVLKLGKADGELPISGTYTIDNAEKALNMIAQSIPGAGADGGSGDISLKFGYRFSNDNSMVAIPDAATMNILVALEISQLTYPVEYFFKRI